MHNHDAKPVARLIEGFSQFRREYFDSNRELYGRLVAEGQKPSVAVIACSDSRVDPAIVLQARPGEIFSIRNVANLVPPFDAGGGHHGTSAALEFAVCRLKVNDIVVFGHAHCAGIKALIDNPDTREQPAPGDFITAWTSIGIAARRRISATLAAASPQQRQRACEQEAVMVSLENLMTFPWIQERVANGSLALHGWYIDIANGKLSAYDPAQGRFELLG